MAEIRHRNYQEFLAYWKGRGDLDQTNLFYRAMLETLEDAAAKERIGQHVDPTTIFHTSIKKAETFRKVVQDAIQIRSSSHAVSSSPDSGSDSNFMER
jgi:hypothetical protein